MSLKQLFLSLYKWSVTMYQMQNYIDPRCHAYKIWYLVSRALLFGKRCTSMDLLFLRFTNTFATLNLKILSASYMKQLLYIYLYSELYQMNLNHIFTKDNRPIFQSINVLQFNFLYEVYQYVVYNMSYGENKRLIKQTPLSNQSEAAKSTPMRVVNMAV